MTPEELEQRLVKIEAVNRNQGRRLNRQRQLLGLSMGVAIIGMLLSFAGENMSADDRATVERIAIAFIATGGTTGALSVLGQPVDDDDD